jgi:hypothetical protein
MQLRAIEKLLGQPIPRAAGSAAPAHPVQPMRNPRHNGQRDARPGQPSGFRPRRPAHARQSHGA